MAINTDKNSYTLVFAVAMVLVVGSLLAFTASSLAPNIEANERVEKQQNILYALGVNENEGNGDIAFVAPNKVTEAFKNNIANQIVLELKDGKIINEMTGEEFLNSKDEDKGYEPYLIDIKKEQADYKNGEARFLPMFKGQQEDGKIVYVIPIRGKGLWDAIWGYVAVDKDLVVRGTFFDHAGETPGLGANIKQRYFMDDFYGERLLTEAGVFKGITVAKGNNDPKNDIKDDYEVDALAGSTITGDGVTAMIKKDLKLYLPYFQNLN